MCRRNRLLTHEERILQWMANFMSMSNYEDLEQNIMLIKQMLIW